VATAGVEPHVLDVLLFSCIVAPDTPDQQQLANATCDGIMLVQSGSMLDNVVLFEESGSSALRGMQECERLSGLLRCALY